MSRQFQAQRIAPNGNRVEARIIAAAHFRHAPVPQNLQFLSEHIMPERAIRIAAEADGKKVA